MTNIRKETFYSYLWRKVYKEPPSLLLLLFFIDNNFKANKEMVFSSIDTYHSFF